MTAGILSLSIATIVFAHVLLTGCSHSLLARVHRTAVWIQIELAYQPSTYSNVNCEGSAMSETAETVLVYSAFNFIEGLRTCQQKQPWSKAGLRTCTNTLGYLLFPATVIRLELTRPDQMVATFVTTYSKHLLTCCDLACVAGGLVGARSKNS